ncbi:hypothetical protein DASC09_003760 [Saccharomycopsis crataegensis]|uniref:Aminoglycoside phosphotransferase domain-containing protein n=1 Tax=Saccharomycopsis crataegensis TaxID=43959 RepID=A0AAV5QE82_9ASCO|nr:hypothetical protein DASC09_003760 [Saccharomycopsis crataegensis]
MQSAVATDKDIGDIRSPIDIDKLCKFLSGCSNLSSNPKIHLGPLSSLSISLPVKINQFKYGQSNPTYYIQDANHNKYILRRKPSANSKLLSRKAHNIEREFWIAYDIANLNITENFSIPVAMPLVLVEDEQCLGMVFYISEFVEGFIFHDPSMPTLTNFERDKCWESVVQVASQIHQVPVSGLVHCFPQRGKAPKGNLNYFQRQIKSLAAIHKFQSSQSNTPPIYGFGKLCDLLSHNCPPDPQLPVLIHGDFKIDNFIFDLQTYRIIAVLDWELCTIGNPIFDLANALQNYYFPRAFNSHFLGIDLSPDPKFVNLVLQKYYQIVCNLWPSNSITKDDGNLFLWITQPRMTTNEELNHINNGSSSFNTYKDIIGSFYDSPLESSSVLFKYWISAKAFSCFRLSVIIQGIHARVINGTNSSGFAEKFSGSYGAYSKLGLSLMDAGIDEGCLGTGTEKEKIDFNPKL